MIDIELDIGLDWSDSGFGQLEVEKAVDAAMRVAALPGLAAYPAPVEVSIKLTDDAEVHALNREWRDKNKPTNVLSFPMLEEDELESFRRPEPLLKSFASNIAAKIKILEHKAPEVNQVQAGGVEMELLLGDIVLAHGVCVAEAEQKDIPIAHHATHLVIHGMLHLLGHDHIDEDEAESMEALEVKALASMGLHNPYDV
jgi:probable rRNA maturation factor